MRYPAFGPCPYCGERMVFYSHWTSLAVGALGGLATALTFMLIMAVFS